MKMFSVSFRHGLMFCRSLPDMQTRCAATPTVPVMWGGNKRKRVYPRSTRNVSLQTLGFRFGLNLRGKKKNDQRHVYRIYTGTNNTSGTSSDRHCCQTRREKIALRLFGFPKTDQLWYFHCFGLRFVQQDRFSFLGQSQYINNSWVVQIPSNGE